MLKTRILTALVLGAVLCVVVLALPPLATIVLLTVVIFGGAWEWSAFLGAPARWQRALYLLLIAVLLPASWWMSGSAEGLSTLLLVVSIWWIFALLWLTRAPQRVTPLAAAVAGVLALVPAWLAIARLRTDYQDGEQWTMFALILIVAADTGAFFAGRQFGRVKLAPRVSPGKTWEGALGGVALAALVATGGAAIFDLPIWPMLLVGVLVAAFSIVGDLTESMFKRHSGVKDSGSLFPGHGGILDRIDSITAGAPLLLWGVLQLGLVQRGALP